MYEKSINANRRKSLKIFKIVGKFRFFVIYLPKIYLTKNLYCNEKTTTNRHDSGIYQLLVICRTCIESMEERQEYRDAGSFRAARDHVQQRHADYQDHQYHH